MDELKLKATALLKTYHIVPDAIHFGQHFLIEPGTIDFFVKTSELSLKDTVLEIGPGLGFITKALAKKAKSVTALEIDERMEAPLELVRKAMPNVHIIINTVMQQNDFNYDLVCGALSYSIFEPLLRKLYRNEDFKKGVFIVSDKFAADFDRHDSILSLLADAFFNVSIIKKLPREFFYPEPRADGLIIKLIRRSEAADAYHFVLRELFMQGDKKVKNALRESLINYYRSIDKQLTKNEARAMIKDLTSGVECNEVIFQCGKEYLKKIDSFLRSIV